MDLQGLLQGLASLFEYLTVSLQLHHVLQNRLRWALKDPVDLHSVLNLTYRRGRS